MNAVKTTPCRECVDRMGVRLTMDHIPVDVTKKSSPPPPPPAYWELSKNPIELHNKFDKVHWNLNFLKTEYGSSATFYLEFTSVIYTSPPGTLNKNLGPFTKVYISGNELIGEGRIADYGCYFYDIWVIKSPAGDKEQILFSIDPQVDNLRPPAGGNQ